MTWEHAAGMVAVADFKTDIRMSMWRRLWTLLVGWGFRASNVGSRSNLPAADFPDGDHPAVDCLDTGFIRL